MKLVNNFIMKYLAFFNPKILMKYIFKKQKNWNKQKNGENSDYNMNYRAKMKLNKT